MVKRVVVWFLVGKISLLALVCIAGVLYVVSASVPHYAPTPGHVPAYHFDAGAPVLSTARSYAIFDATSGALLAAQDAETPYPVASVTKLPAAAVATVVVPLEATTTLIWDDIAAEGRAGKLEAGQVYTYRDLLFPLLLESSNDAAAVFERTYHDQVVTAMNEIVTAYGASPATRFVDTSGLSDRNVATARDLALITTGLYAAHPYIFDITTLSQYISHQTGWINNNPVVHEDGYLGGKHGYTEAAGRTIVALFDESFTAGRRQVGYVVLGSSNLAADVAALREFVRSSVRFE
jgi:D-alanyl-D-alanine carboxypeptidase